MKTSNIKLMGNKKETDGQSHTIHKQTFNYQPTII